MKILLLGPKNERIKNYFNFNGEEIYQTEKEIDLNFLILNRIEFIISYGYRYIIKEDILKNYFKKSINLHISYLPWNKGADPNLWSFLEDTPKGVSIHYISSELDKGDLLLQKQIEYFSDDTLRTTYDRLCRTIEDLLFDNWNDIKNSRIISYKQKNINSYHRSYDKEKWLYLLKNGWDTSVLDVLGKAKIKKSRCNYD